MYSACVSGLIPCCICRLKSKVAAVFGLIALHEGKYKNAAEKFISCHIDIGASYNEVLHSEDIALYGGICALATLTRDELRDKVCFFISQKCSVLD